MAIRQNKVDEAIACFDERFNCAQAVLSTYCEEFDMDKQLALKVAGGMGAGMGRLQETCGAVTGAYMLIGLMHGKDTIGDEAAKEKTYALVQEFAKRFVERNGSTGCRELIGVDLVNGDKQTIADQVVAVCPKMIRDAVEIIEELLF